MAAMVILIIPFLTNHIFEVFFKCKVKVGTTGPPPPTPKKKELLTAGKCVSIMWSERDLLLVLCGLNISV